MRRTRSHAHRALGIAAAVMLGIVACGTGERIDTTAQTSDTDNPVYFVHGYADNNGKNCQQYWGNAMGEFNDNGWEGPLRTVGFYVDDSHCDVTVGNGEATVETKINQLAADLAHHVHQHNARHDQAVDLVGHSMGGIVSRIAVLGSARGWPGFPGEQLRVDNVITLDSPHGGVRCNNTKQACPDNPQWQETERGSPFMGMVHAPQNRLDQEWARGTKWSFVGSDEDRTVTGNSGIDESFYSDIKVRYLQGSEPELTHTAVPAVTSGDFNLRVWRADADRTELSRDAPAPARIAAEAAS